MARPRSKTKSSRGRAVRRESVLLSRSVLISMTGISETDLTLWEHEEFLVPARTVEREGHEEPLYSRDALRRIRVIRALAEELEVNLSGIGIVLHLLDQMTR
jgi:DNA-binding transcriptional MerR regulator